MTEVYPIEELLPYWVYRVQTEGVALLARRFKGAGIDVTPEQFGVLARLAVEQGMNQAQLAERMLKDRPNMTRILNQLEKRGYIERRPDSSDKRIFRIFLTENGREVQEELMPIFERHLGELLDGILDPDQKVTCGILKRIVSNIHDCGRDF
jgi:DNA-binding MarR family transcriptional regulator